MLWGVWGTKERNEKDIWVRERMREEKNKARHRAQSIADGGPAADSTGAPAQAKSIPGGAAVATPAQAKLSPKGPSGFRILVCLWRLAFMPLRC